MSLPNKGKRCTSARLTTALFVIIALVFAMAPLAAADTGIVAGSPMQAPDERLLNATPDDTPALSIHDGNYDVEGGTASSGLTVQEDEALPSAYDARAEGHVTPVKDQRDSGWCWSFSTLSAVESSLLAHDKAVLASNGSSPDLSERHLAYFTYHPTPDPLGYTDGDYNAPIDFKYVYGVEEGGEYFVTGGNPHSAGYTLAAWRGAVDEEKAPFTDLMAAYDRYWDYKMWVEAHAGEQGGDAGGEAPDVYPFSAFLADTDLPADAGMADASWRLTGFHHIALSDREDVKRAVMEYGGAVMHVQLVEDYFNGAKSAYYYYGNYATNHVLTIVGWDDDYAKANFVGASSGIMTRRPPGDGAWLCKNSWGTGWGDEGYVWVSYYDASQRSSLAKAFVYDAEPAGVYDNIYQHDGSSTLRSNSVLSGGSVANVFTARANADGAETLEAVGFALDDVNVDYSVQVYLNLRDAADPTSGSPALAKPAKGATSYAGYYTVPLDVSVPLAEGTTYSVVIALSHADGSAVTYAVDANASADGGESFVSAVHPNESFERDAASEPWDDLSAASCDSGDKPACAARVKAFTCNASTDALGPLPFENAVVKLGEKAANAVYTGKAIRPAVSVTYGGAPLVSGVDYRVTYASNVAAGQARVMVEPLGDYGGVAREIPFTIAPAKQVVTVAGKTKTFGAKPFALGARALGSAKLTYSSSNRKVATVTTVGKVTVRGAGEARITVKAAATRNYKAGSKTVIVKVRKAAQSLVAKARVKTVNCKAGKSLTASKVFTVKSAKGKVTYTRTSGSNRVSVAKNGTISVKKGTKPGLYKLSVRASAAGNANYKSGSRVVVLSVRV